MGLPIYMVKIGGSMITDTSKESVAKRAQIDRLLGEIVEARAGGEFGLILGHGAGSFGHVAAKKYRISEGIVDDQSMKGFAITHMAMRELNRVVVDSAIRMGLDPCPFEALSFGYAKGGRIAQGNIESIREAIDRGFMPIVHGDGVLDSERGVAIASTEEVFRFIASGIKPKKIILGTDMDGVFDSDPRLNPNARLLERIDSGNINTALEGAGGAMKVDVTGGMKTKLGMLHSMVKQTGAEGYIANAGTPGTIRDLLLSKDVRCTRVIA
ncbi:MAG: isopentenyl phosphate kinase family protein [Candidatus Micrarchaeota archaeon]|nr:isopentenyl phosphate kinase family protein [Candidatus Micrarchaeota archaeon]